MKKFKKKKVISLLAASVIAFNTFCSPVQVNKHERLPRAEQGLEEKLAVFDYDNEEEFEYNIKKIEYTEKYKFQVIWDSLANIGNIVKVLNWLGITEEGYEVFDVMYESPVRTAYKKNNMVHARYYKPKSEKPLDLIILLNQLGGNLDITGNVAEYFAKRGFACLNIDRAYSKSRKVSGLGYDNVDHLFIRDATIQTVKDVRRSIDLLESRESIDRVGIFGISMGAIIGSLCMGVDERIESGTFILGGGNPAGLIWNSQEPYIMKNLKAKLIKRGISHEQLERDFEIVDPITYACRIDPSKVLMVYSSGDKYVPNEFTLQLCESIECCNGGEKVYTIVMPSLPPIGSLSKYAHFSPILFYPFIKENATKHFERTLM